MSTPSASHGFMLEVKLQFVRPTVSRTLEFASSMTFLELHQTLQLAMGWEDTHLFEFTHRKITVVSPDDDVPASTTTWIADQHTVAEWDLQPGDTFVYRYDFGDDWVHEIRIVRATSEPLSRPHVLSGEGACPPDDVGGPPGYEAFLEIMADPKHPEHHDYKAWSRGRFVPQFDVAAANRRLAKKFR